MGVIRWGACLWLWVLLVLTSVLGQEAEHDDTALEYSGDGHERIKTKVGERRIGIPWKRELDGMEYSSFEVESHVEYYVKFWLNPADLKEEDLSEDASKILQVNMYNNDSTAEFPIEVTIRQFRRTVSYRLPDTRRNEQGNITYSSDKRSVDFCAVKNLKKNMTITASISTSSETPVTLFMVAFIKGKSAEWNKTSSDPVIFSTRTAISPSQTRTRFFDTTHMDEMKDAMSIIVEVTLSNTMESACVCSVVSIQPPSCNFQDTIGMRMKGQWKTMLNHSAMIVDPKDFPKGFLLVMVASSRESFCNIEMDEHRCSILNKDNTHPKKYLNITVKSNGSSDEYIIATMAIIVPYIGIFILSIAFSVAKFKYQFNKFEKIDENLKKLKENLGFQVEAREGYKLMDGLKKSQALWLVENEKNKARLQTPALISGEEKDPNMPYIDDAESMILEHFKNEQEEPVEDFELIANIDDLNKCKLPKEDFDMSDRKTKLRLKRQQFVTDMSTKMEDPSRTKSVYQKSQLYIGVLMLISMYYALPVLQMVFRFSNEQRETGNEDLCYYNDLCRKPLGISRDFNHLFSNFGYFVFGILFIVLVLMKKQKYEKFLLENRAVDGDCYGVPQQFGLCFAMGLALAMEGIMSSSYHVCPTNVTFQFDTTFMYIMSVMMFLKLYQVRHSDVSANAVGVFFGLGIALILETFSIYYSGPLFWFIFLSTYFVAIVIVALHAYNVGAVRYKYKMVLCGVAKILYLEMCNLKKGSGSPAETRPRLRSRVVGVTVIMLLNFALLVYFGVQRTHGSSNYFLAIFMLNTAMYTVYYCVMKHLFGETINKVPIVYTILGLICFLPALYFFTQKEKNSETSPAESRSLNRDCLLLNFYDGHDIWHFLGGAGVFFAFMFYFTVDDDLKYKKRNTIPVF